jgi:beta-xylosidase
MKVAVAILLLLLPLAATAAPSTQPATTQSSDAFIPGAVWLDDQGKPINCHGGGFVYQDGTYYWFGEFKVGRRTPGHIGVSCYSSTDLYHWTNHGLMLSAGPDAGDLSDGCVIERPKVIFNARTKKFVMWFHLELRGQGYRAARAAVAVSESVTGPYTYLESFRPNAGVWPVNFPKDLQQPLPAGSQARQPDDYVRRDFVGGQMSRDMTLFVDQDGSAYHIYASEENQTTQISKLSDDYLKPAGQYARALVGGANEAASMFKHDGRYYLITSGTTGWAPNPARLAVADHIFGPWKAVGNPCIGPKDQTDTTFASQAAYVLPIAGKQDAFIYVGDRWKFRDLPSSGYVWLPIHFDGDRVSIQWFDRWDLSIFDTKNTGRKTGSTEK